MRLRWEDRLVEGWHEQQRVGGLCRRERIMGAAYSGSRETVK